jgi:hypothetical protein
MTLTLLSSSIFCSLHLLTPWHKTVLTLLPSSVFFFVAFVTDLDRTERQIQMKAEAIE